MRAVLVPRKKKSLASYTELKRRVLETIERGRERARQAVEREFIRTAWEMGKLIHKHILLNKKRAKYGEGVIPRLSQDIRKRKDVLYRALEIYRSSPKVVPVRLLSQSHFYALLALNDPDEREALAAQSEKNGWSRDRLRREIQKLKSRWKAEKPQPLLIPKKGKTGIFRIVKRHGLLSIDKGFKTFVSLGSRPKARRDDKAFTEGDFVSISAGGRFRKVKASAEDLFTYEADLIRVVDGDTQWLRIWVKRPEWCEEKIRLRGIDCPEQDTPEGQRAKRFVRRLFKKATAITITTTKPDKYDRYLSDVFLQMPDGKEIFLNNLLLEKGLAVRKTKFRPRDWDTPS